MVLLGRLLLGFVGNELGEGILVHLVRLGYGWMGSFSETAT